MLLIRQNYKFESYLQQCLNAGAKVQRCCWYVKITNLKAIYNTIRRKIPTTQDVVDTSKLQIWKLFTTQSQVATVQKKMLLIRQNYKFESYLQQLFIAVVTRPGCCWYVKITNLKAIYNLFLLVLFDIQDVVDTSKLQIWKLFTTSSRQVTTDPLDVVDTSKLQIWKLFTTEMPFDYAG